MNRPIIKIFIFILLIVGITINKAVNDLVFPPQIGACPDYWQKLQNGKCQNVQGLGSNCTSPMNFNTPEFGDEKNLKKMCEFAKGCNIEWDGITNNQLC